LLGPRAGGQVLRLGTGPHHTDRHGRAAHGFDLHAGRRVSAFDRRGLERLCRYPWRAPSASTRSYVPTASTRCASSPSRQAESRAEARHARTTHLSPSAKHGFVTRPASIAAHLRWRGLAKQLAPDHRPRGPPRQLDLPFLNSAQCAA
jgi:hypothetical protein